MRTVVLPHVNEWKRVPKVARGVVAERGRWDGRRCEEEGNGSSREEREREKEEEGHTSGSKEARARRRETPLLDEQEERASGKKRERGKKGRRRREAHGPCIERSRLLCSQGRSLPREGAS